MIRFPCPCGHRFELPDDQAGTAVQCPGCKRLVDVPLLGELDSIADDGTVRMAPSAVVDDPHALDRMLYVYARTKVDDAGEEIDLRDVVGEEDDIGEYELASDARRREKPRYDPETGELVRPIELAGEHDAMPPVDPSTIPFAKPSITYAAWDTLRTKSAGRMVTDLGQPMNVVVMLFILILHFFGAFFTFFAAMGIFIVAVPIVILVMALLGHWANVVDEVGVEERDELPRPLRDLRFHEDIWGPFVAAMATGMICYAPAAWALASHRLADGVAVVLGVPLALAGTFLLPAILITLTTSGTLMNLRPDRVISVIRASGGRYFTVVLLFVLAAIPYLAGIVGMVLGACRLTGKDDGLPAWVSRAPLVLPCLAIGIFLMHLACFHIGMLYRANHERFQWVGQFHVKRDLRPPVQRKRVRYVPPPAAP